MRLHKILCLGILFFVFVRLSSFAQCGQATQQSAVSTTPKVLPSPKTANHDSEDRTVVLQLEMTDRGSVRDVEVLGNPGQLRAAAIAAAVKFANGRNHLDRFTWPLVMVVVRFPQNGHGVPQVRQAMPAGVPGCVSAPTRIRVSSVVMGCYLVHRVEPVYPAGTENTKYWLTLAVLVGKDGNVLNARKVSGPENLAPAAIEAVRKWKYRPYMLNGEPVELETTVDLPAGGCLWTGPSAAQDPFTVTSAPPSWLFNTQPVIPVLAASDTGK